MILEDKKLDNASDVFVAPLWHIGMAVALGP